MIPLNLVGAGRSEPRHLVNVTQCGNECEGMCGT